MTTLNNRLAEIIHQAKTGELSLEWAIAAVKQLYTDRELMGPASIASYVGRPRSTVQGWYTHPPRTGAMPLPITTLSSGPAWWKDELDEWLIKNPLKVARDSPADKTLWTTP